MPETEHTKKMVRNTLKIAAERAVTPAQRDEANRWLAALDTFEGIVTGKLEAACPKPPATTSDN